MNQRGIYHMMTADKIKEAIEHYWNARVLMQKSFQKLNYRIKDKSNYNSFLLHKKSVYKSLRRMDKLLRRMIGDD